MGRTIRLDDDEQRVVENALDLYIRVGLGQFSEIARRLDLIHGERLNPDQTARVGRLCEEIEDALWEDREPWRLEHPETSLYTLLAFLVEGRLCRNDRQVAWADRRCRERRRVEGIEKRET